MNVKTEIEFEADLTVMRREEAADGVVSLTLRAPDGSSLPIWQPGAHIDLLLADDLVRQYSLSGDPADRASWRIGVLREPAGRGGSAFVHDQLHEGSVVRVRGPRNHFELTQSEEYLFIAGGIGVTPILPMVRAADAAGRAWRLVYGGRSLSSMAFREELEIYGDRVTFWPQDERGIIDLVELLAEPRPSLAIYSCGPGGMLDAIETHMAQWPHGALHTERFTAKPLTEPVISGTFEIELANAGITLEVPPQRSVLQILHDAGFDIPSSCSEGTCGTCETPVLAGIPDHRDSVLDADERALNDCMMVCVSRSKSPRLVLDV